jgi:uncharacterized protein with gpF-like domain
VAAREVNQDIEKLTAEWQPKLRDAFLEAVAKIQSLTQVQAVANALAAGDVDGALAAVGLEPGVWRPLDAGTTAAFDAGGEALAGRLTTSLVRAAQATATTAAPRQAPRLAVVFNARNQRAEGWLRQHSATLVKEISDDQRTAVREHLEAGMAAGLNPRTVALDLVGRINVQSGKREGGVIGLTSSQAAWARNYEAELTNLNPNALLRNLRDKRFDGAVRKAVKAGQPLSPGLIQKMVAAYRTRALRYRAESIGRTEAIASLNQSQKEAMQQAIDVGKVKARYVTKTWKDARDVRVRNSHVHLNGQTVPFSGKFKSISGATLDYPGDPEAPAEERINCRCRMAVKVDFIAQAVDDGV